MNPIEQLFQAGQSLWYDNIQRILLENGEMAKMVADGDIRGVTSNPSIFHNAIAKSHDYDEALNTMAWAGGSADQIYDRLSIEDIQCAADLFLPLYQESKRADGYVSLEVNPLLAHDTMRTVSEAQRLWDEVGRPNLMIKIPATPEGIPAITQVIARGINVNATLIFSLERYKEVITAYLNGLKLRRTASQPINSIASVASFFISRVDSKVDAALQKIIERSGEEAETARKLFGKAAIANARLAYEIYEKEFSGAEFQDLARQGARIQRPLWASTSTKNPAYRDVLYVEELIGKNTVNTVPPQTLKAFKDHGVVKETIHDDLDGCHRLVAELAELGISMDQVTLELENEGVKSFADAFVSMLETIEERRKAAILTPPELQKKIQARIEQLIKDETVERLYVHDPSLWTDDPDGSEVIRNRLGWLDLPEKSRTLVDELRNFPQELKKSGIKRALILGMGGSSLAPEVMSKILGTKSGIELDILDSTDPDQVSAVMRNTPSQETLFIVSSKSGSTAEVSAFLDTFWERCVHRVGSDKASQHFIAITDPGTSLEKLARDRHFRRIFLSDPTVGGRYSALTPFGLVPAAILGVDLNQALDLAAKMMAQCMPGIPGGRNPGLVAGAILGQAALMGMNKLTILADPELVPFGAWLEQLIAESSGKQGKGILPVDQEPHVRISKYGKDRIFVYLRLNGNYDHRTVQLRKAGHPVITYTLRTPEDLYGEFYRWGIATSIACSILGVNAFDQPDVQDNKDRTVEKIKRFKESHRLEEPDPIWKKGEVSVYGNWLPGLEKSKTLQDVLKAILQESKEGDFIAINAYVARNRINQSRLQKMRKWLLESSGRATTLGFGPRFLHSTGQLHKGGPDQGIFIQITKDPKQDLEIPGEGITFGILERAQSLGDYEALEARGRRGIRIHFRSLDELEKLVESLP